METGQEKSMILNVLFNFEESNNFGPSSIIKNTNGIIVQIRGRRSLHEELKSKWVPSIEEAFDVKKRTIATRSKTFYFDLINKQQQ